MQIPMACRPLLLLHLPAFIHATPTPAPAPPTRTYSAPPSLINPPSFNESLPILNTSLGANFTVPKDPSDVRHGASHTSIEIYAFGRSLTHLYMIKAQTSISIAKKRAAFHSHEMSREIGTDNVFRFGFPGIILVCYPRQPLTWSMWSEALTALSVVVSWRDFHREFQFLILEDGMEGEIGYGSLALVP